MLNLSFTACSFHIKNLNDANSICNINQEKRFIRNTGEVVDASNIFDIIQIFFEENPDTIKDDNNSKAMKCSYNSGECLETDEFKMYPILIKSGVYGIESDIYDLETDKVKYKRSKDEVDMKQFYFVIVLPKDNDLVCVQKGIFIFQNLGTYGIKTFVTDKLKDFLKDNFELKLTCKTLSPEIFVKKVLKRENVRKLTMIKNVKSSDSVDNYDKGYGQETKTISKIRMNDNLWNQIKNILDKVTGSKCNIYEFDHDFYDNFKVEVQIGERSRTISLNNIENISIIESLPDRVRDESGNANKEELMDYLKMIIPDYLSEMVLEVKYDD